MRYQGPWGSVGDARHTSTATALAFRAPTEGLQEPAVGYSAGAWEIVRVLTLADVPMLETRLAEARARNLTHEVREVSCVLAELQETKE
jgi:hypothetical protein